MLETISHSVEIGKKDFDWAIGLNRTCFAILGVWPDYRPNFRHTMHAPFLIFFMSISLLIPELWALILVIDHLPLVLDNLFLVCAFSITKLIIYWLSKEKFSEIVMIITRDWCRDKLDWERDIMLKAAGRGRLVTISSFFLLLSITVGLFIGPTVGVVLRKINNITDHDHRHLPVQSFYPFDVSKTPIFQLTILSQFFGGLLVSTCFFGTAVFFACVVYHICGQLEILSMKINNLHISKETTDVRDAIWLHSIKKLDRSIAELVSYHVNIIKTISVAERFFRLLLLVEIFNMSVLMCSFGFQVVNSLNESGEMTLARLVFPLGTGINIMLHSLIYCFSGELLSNSSEHLFHCFCLKEWYVFPRRNVLDLIPIIQQTQIPLRLSAGKIMFLNFATFCNILKTIAGYISVFLAVRQK